MATILVTTFPHEGHLNPTFPIARELGRLGLRILYLDHPAISQRIREEGFDGLPNRHPSLSDLLFLWRKLRLERSRRMDEVRKAIILFTTQLEIQARFVYQLIKRNKPDLIFNDAFCYSSSLAAEMAGIPWVDCWSAGLVHSSPSKRRPDSRAGAVDKKDGGDFSLPSAISEAFDLFDRRINRARQNLKLSLQPPGVFLRPSRWLQIFLTSHEVEFPRHDLGPTAVFVGPSCSGRRDTVAHEIFPWDWVLQGSPVVYVSLGNFFNKHPGFFHRIIEAFRGSDLRVVVSTPLADSKKFRNLPSNIRFFHRVPQLTILSKTAVFLCHGGNNSVNEAMAAGTPLLMTPIGGEQVYNAERARWLGVGLIADMERSTPDELRRLTLKIISDPSFRQSAQEVKRILGRCNAPKVCSQLIQRILETKKPITRPPGAPITLYADMLMPDWARSSQSLANVR